MLPVFMVRSKLVKRTHLPIAVVRAVSESTAVDMFWDMYSKSLSSDLEKSDFSAVEILGSDKDIQQFHMWAQIKG
jgi:hypothetical protein